MSRKAEPASSNLERILPASCLNGAGLLIQLNEKTLTMKRTIALATTALLALPASLLAHEGHGHTEGSSPLHYVAEPYHAAIFLLAVALIVGIGWRLSKRWRKQ